MIWFVCAGRACIWDQFDRERHRAPVPLVPVHLSMMVRVDAGAVYIVVSELARTAP